MTQALRFAAMVGAVVATSACASSSGGSSARASNEVPPWACSARMGLCESACKIALSDQTEERACLKECRTDTSLQC